MPDAIDDNPILFDFEQNPIIANPQAVFRSKICEPLDISLQIIAHLPNSCKDSALAAGGQTLNVFYRLRFELDIIFHIPIRTSLSSLGEHHILCSDCLFGDFINGHGANQGKTGF
jgi:hypothetical protein